jgi:hypothetical protein
MGSISGISGSVVILKIHILSELGAVDYSQLPIFTLIQFWEIGKFLTNELRESACIMYVETRRYEKRKNVFVMRIEQSRWRNGRM